MNKFLEIIMVTLGAFNKVMSIFIPIAVALLIIRVYPEVTTGNFTILITIASLASLFRAVSLWVE